MLGGTSVFGSLGFTEIAFVLVLALLLFGPKRLPEIGRTIGKGLSEFRRASNDLTRTLEREVALDDIEQRASGTLTPLRPGMVDPNAPRPAAAAVEAAPVPAPAPAPDPAAGAPAAPAAETRD
jgi:TatA/E family protein of Tat protein translocase